MSSPLLSHANIHGLLRHVLRLAVPVSAVLTIYLYLYPFFLTCGFPLPATSPQDGHLGAWLETMKLHLPGRQPSSSDSDPDPSPGLRVAPFRLLALGDPQIEGDTSIPNYYWTTSFPHLHSFVNRLVSRSDDYPSFHASTKQAFHDLVDFYFDDIPANLESLRKRIDLFGNDFYLAHMFRAVHWWTVPTHVAVLGDLVGSQWISDEEFDRRSRRYWHRAFKGGERVPDDVAAWPAVTYDPAGELGTKLYDDVWQRRILNVAGNHDIGYAGDLTNERMDRFERVFGKANYELRFELPTSVLSPAGAATIRNETADSDYENNTHHHDRLTPELRIVLLNSMNLDTPVATSELQDQTYSFINDVINTATAVEFKGHFTVVLTHVPLYKPEGTCVDAPYFTFHDDGTLKEQNQLSADASKGFVEGIFGLNGDASAAGGGMGRRGVVLNGHDHEGCDTWHFINQSEPARQSDGPQSSDSADELEEPLHSNDGGEPDQFDRADDGDDAEKPDAPRDSELLADTTPPDEPTHPVREWQARTWRNATSEGIVSAPSLPGVREITVRSMMGGYGGNAGLLSAWFDEETWEWRFEYATCALGTQHLWWAVHITDLIVAVLLVVYGVMSVLPRPETKSVPEKEAQTDKNGSAHGLSGTKTNGVTNG
ncbi:hypothetical protein N0V82_004880 [Gnomoniopsis sp. IMI 355080]|nr:hypothetical protein N0V82_004880 [Gnomoniopsis sp. IMI 355080]